MLRYEIAFSGYRIALAFFALTLASCQKDDGKAPVKERLSGQAAPLAHAAPKERVAIHSDKPFRRYEKYVGMIGDKFPLTLEMTLGGYPYGLSASGQVRYGDTGASMGFTGNFFDTDKFEFIGHRANWDSVLFSGSFAGFDAFEGSCTLFRIDSTYDSIADAWKKTSTAENHPFRIAKTAAGTVPVEFEIYTRENDSGSEWRKRERKIEYSYDTVPSSLQLVMIKVKSSNSHADSLINNAIFKSMLDFYAARSDAKFPDSGASIQTIMDDFDKEWAYFKGEFFDIDFYCDIEANENGILSIRYTENAYAGGAHGNISHILESYDVASGNKIRIQDVLRPGFRIPLGGLANIPWCDGDPENEHPCSIESLLEGGFAITHDGLDFNTSEVGHEKAIHIPYAALDSLIEKPGILSSFLPDLD